MICCLTKAKEAVLPYYLPIATGRKTDGFMPFLSAFVRYEMQITSSSIWIRVADSSSYDGNRDAIYTLMFVVHL